MSPPLTGSPVLERVLCTACPSMKMTETCQSGSGILGMLEAGWPWGCHWARQKKLAEWSDGITEQWGSWALGQGQGRLSLGADLCPVSRFQSMHCPMAPTFKTMLQTLEGFANGVRNRAANRFAWVSVEGREEGRARLFKLL